VDVLRAVDQLSEALLHLRQGREERLVTELTLIRLTRPETGFDAEALAVRLERLEQRVQTGQVGAVPAPAAPLQPAPSRPAPSKPSDSESGAATRSESDAAAPPTETPETPTPETDAVSSPPAASPEPMAMSDVDIATYESAWPAIAARMRDLAGPSRHALLKEVRPASVEDGTVIFELPGHLPFHLEQLRADTELHQLLQQASSEFVGGGVAVSFRAQIAAANEPADPPEPVRAPDKDDLLDADEGAIDPTELVVDILGGEVVDE
jgi:DNA polymerase-3 subunit gamma/tau